MLTFYRLALVNVLTAFVCTMPALAQMQVGTVRGVVSDPNSAAVAAAEVRLSNGVTGFVASSRTDAGGEFFFNNVPFGSYQLSVQASGFQTLNEVVPVRSNVPVVRNLKLTVASTVLTVDVKAGDEGILESSKTSTDISIDQERISAVPMAGRGGAVQKVIATAPGVTTQNNGLMHIRGSEDGLVYVVDGVPTMDRVDAVSASSFDIGVVRSVQVITGNFPAEFGGRNGAVAVVQERAGIDEDLRGEFSLGAGNFAATDAAGAIAYGWHKRFGIFLAGASSRGNRYLDPVDERNFNNHGARRNFAFRVDWHPTKIDFLSFDIGINGSNFDVPNDFLQQTAGQRQGQRLRDNNESISWQHSFNPNVVSNLAWFRRSYRSDLIPSAFDVPLTAAQDRHHVREGVLASVSAWVNKHSIKAGFEATRINLREFFTFAVTNDELAEERGISEAAREFTPDDPFVFNASRKGYYCAAYIQDEFSPFKNFTVAAGIRYERSSLPSVEHQVSPRIGVSYLVPRTRTVFRASFNRLYQPPQLENLLLSDSDQARALSPFIQGGLPGGVEVRAERVSAYEVGARRAVSRFTVLDVSYWYRTFKNFGDPNTFFNTTLVFPNSVAKGFARGIDVRIDVPERRGFSGYVSYTNARILQTGPITGGLFLTDDFLEIGPGTRFIPDHDQRNVGSFAVTYAPSRASWFATFAGRYESGVPLEVSEDRTPELRNAQGADLVNFDRLRVLPRMTFDLQAGRSFRKTEKHGLRLELNVENLFNRRFAYNFGDPFEGTHFGHPRLVSGKLVVNLAR